MNWLSSQLAFAAACIKWGQSVGPLPILIDGAQLLWALGGNESSFGQNTKPRHEPAFDVGGAYGASGNMPHLLALYGPAAACSYGPLQVMLTNVPDFSPVEMGDLDTAMQASIGFLNSQLKNWKPTTLTAIGEMWNAGHPLIIPSTGVAVYCANLQKNYLIPIPEAA